MRVLLLNQCFYPDVASTAQHLTDLAVGLASSGHEVTVIASDRGYDNTAIRFPRRETWQGIRIIRIPSLALGKSAKWRRALNFASFLFVCSLRILLLGRFDVVVALTSPPLISVLGALFVLVKGGRLIFWVMDLNPDEAIAAGWLKKNSITTKALVRLLGYSLRQAERIIVLDRFMKERIIEKGITEGKLAVIPPWSHTDAVRYDAIGRDAFRTAHNISEKFVVMYSGNHSPCHPLDTLLGAASKLADHEEIAFCFVGGGSEFDKVKDYARQNALKNIICLPYQPLNELAMSLSAADLQVVVMGDPFTGIVHPCKIYNILEIGSPVLYVGPGTSHIVEVISKLEDRDLVCSVRHGDVDTVANYVLAGSKSQAGKRSQSAINVGASFSREVLLPQIIELIDLVPQQRFQSSAVVSDTKAQSML
ncbi:MAG TPA: glycosyltransferase family 4 protein [Pyrinomonadaceae bacterium]|jgi:glycosyltransferase involved in cell wall biosynthesis|nr:glycosyltransferase family 4 protein [Pyrinomonadaceae bacterium]